MVLLEPSVNPLTLLFSMWPVVPHFNCLLTDFCWYFLRDKGTFVGVFSCSLCYANSLSVEPVRCECVSVCMSVYVHPVVVWQHAATPERLFMLKRLRLLDSLVCCESAAGSVGFEQRRDAHHASQQSSCAVPRPQLLDCDHHLWPVQNPWPQAATVTALGHIDPVPRGLAFLLWAPSSCSLAVSAHVTLLMDIVELINIGITSFHQHVSSLCAPVGLCTESCDTEARLSTRPPASPHRQMSSQCFNPDILLIQALIRREPSPQTRLWEEVLRFGWLCLIPICFSS